MVYFTLKLLRFLVRAFVKLLLLPVTVVRWVLGRRGGDDETWDEFDLDDTEAEPETTGGGTDDDESDDAGTAATSAATATTLGASTARDAGRLRFRRHLFVAGLVTVVANVFAPVLYLDGVAFSPIEAVAAQPIWVVGPVAVTGAAAFGLTRGVRGAGISAPRGRRSSSRRI
ncbi:hypothetical protein [Halosegnis marinus]|uniref:hypothetical protein n=1 Tax=Halosegnis marinus TaxID=3034023 RepID=UPI0036172AA9